MTQPPRPPKLCEFVEYGERCTLPRSDHSYKYCSYHWLIVRRERKREEGKFFRDKKPDQYNVIRSRYNRRMTKPKIRTFLDRVEAQKDDAPHPKYEGYKSAVKKLHEAEDAILNPASEADLPSVARIANDKVEELLRDLAKSQREFPHDSTIKRLILLTLALQRDIGQPMSKMTFTTIRTKAKAVHELGTKLGEPLVLGHDLLIDVELARILYFAHYDSPRKRQLYASQARNTLSGAQVFCDMLVERSTGKRLQLAEFLRLYCDSARLRQASDAGEGNTSALDIQEADKRAKHFADAYGDAPIVVHVQFLNLTNHAEYELARIFHKKGQPSSKSLIEWNM